MTRSTAVVVGGVAVPASSAAPGILCTNSGSFNRVRGVELWEEQHAGFAWRAHGRVKDVVAERRMHYIISSTQTSG
jgi:hypothetical protein